MKEIQMNPEPGSNDKEQKHLYNGMFSPPPKVEPETEQESEGYQSGTDSKPKVEYERPANRPYMSDTPIPSGYSDIFQETGIYALKKRRAEHDKNK